MTQIENIIYKDDTKANKIKELSNLYNKRKKIIEDNPNDIIDKLLKYQDNFKKYRKEYEIFFINWKNTIEKIFDEYDAKIKNMIDFLLKSSQIKKKDGESTKNNEIIEKSYNNINSLVNEILSLERKNFNEEK